MTTATLRTQCAAACHLKGELELQIVTGHLRSHVMHTKKTSRIFAVREPAATAADSPQRSETSIRGRSRLRHLEKMSGQTTQCSAPHASSRNYDRHSREYPLFCGILVAADSFGGGDRTTPRNSGINLREKHCFAGIPARPDLFSAYATTRPGGQTVERLLRLTDSGFCKTSWMCFGSLTR